MYHHMLPVCSCTTTWAWGGRAQFRRRLVPRVEPRKLRLRYPCLRVTHTTSYLNAIPMIYIIYPVTYYARMLVSSLLDALFSICTVGVGPPAGAALPRFTHVSPPFVPARAFRLLLLAPASSTASSDGAATHRRSQHCALPKSRDAPAHRTIRRPECARASPRLQSRPPRSLGSRDSSSRPWNPGRRSLTCLQRHPGLVRVCAPA